MDVALHWSGEPPEHVAPLVTALESLPEAQSAPEGTVAFCPDASVVPPPRESPDGLVAMVPNTALLFGPDTREGLLAALRRWSDHGAVFTVPTAFAATGLRNALALPPDRVRAVPLPLPPDRIPPASEPDGTDVVMTSPVAFGPAFNAMNLLRLAGLEFRLVVTDPAAERMVQPGGSVCAFGLMPGYEVVYAGDWRAAARRAAAIGLTAEDSGLGWSLREALATGSPVLAPSTAHIRDHLATIGASAYLYHPHELYTFVDALAGALRGDRGARVGPAAREAVLSERWEDAARAVYRALVDSITPSRTPGRLSPLSARSPRVGVVSEALEVCVLNPKPSGGGGERFMRQLVSAMAAHASAPRIKLIAEINENIAFDLQAQSLEDLGIEVHAVSAAEFGSTVQRETECADVVYCSWPQGAEAPVTRAPLTCTFHDLNWKHFDVNSPAEKSLTERMTPGWIERARAIVHSSQFIRSELHAFYDAPLDLTRVIPTAVEVPVPATPEEHDRVRRRFVLPERFLLSPHGYHLHKNYPALQSALRILRRDGRPVSVVATGMATECLHGPDIIGLGYISAGELGVLYEQCAGMVQTTLYEAGSFPMVEAMAAGKPAAVSRIPPIIEQVERYDIVAELFDPLDPEDVAEAVWRLWSGSVATAPETLAANRRAVTERNWNAVAADYLNMFAELAA